RSYSTTRLMVTAGLDEAPVCNYGLTTALPPSCSVRAVRLVTTQDRFLMMWSPNMAWIAYCPGADDSGEQQLWPQPPADKRLRRIDGSFGRFDYALFPQEWSARAFWAPAMTASAPFGVPRLEYQSVLEYWLPMRNPNGGYIDENVLQNLRTRRTELDGLQAVSRLRLAERSTSTLCREALDSYPGLPSEEQWRALCRITRFEDAVDEWASFVRGLRRAAAAYDMTRDILAYEDSSVEDRTYERPASNRAQLLSGWMNLAPPHWLRFYLAAGYPVYFTHPSERNVLAPIDKRTVISDRWNPFVEAAQLEQDLWQNTTQWTRDEATQPPPTARHAETERDRETRMTDSRADPRSYGYRLGGEEGPPPVPSSSQEEDVIMRAASPAVRASPPPTYSTIERGEAYEIEDNDGNRYRVPAQGSSAYDYHLDRVHIDDARVQWIRPPIVLALTSSRANTRMTAFVPTEVEINGQWRTVYRQIGRSNTARHRYTLMQDRENRRNIYVPRSYQPPPGTIDADVWGMPAPNALYFGIPAGNEPATARRPSLWMYPAEPAASRRVARPGARPSQPRPEDLPRLREEVRTAAVEAQEDLYLQDDDEEDETAEEFYAMPPQVPPPRERSVSPLPLYARSVTSTRSRDDARSSTSMSDRVSNRRSASPRPATSRPGDVRGDSPAEASTTTAAAATSDPHIQRLADALLQEVMRQVRSSAEAEGLRLNRAVAPNLAPVPGPSDTPSVDANVNEPAMPTTSTPSASSGPTGNQGVPTFTSAPLASSHPGAPDPWPTMSVGAPSLPVRVTAGAGSATAFLQVRNLLRWVRAPDIERANHRIMATTGFPRPGLISIYGRNQDGGSGPYSLYLEFRSAAEAERFRRTMGPVWMIQATFATGLPRPNGLFRARAIQFISRDEFVQAATSPDAWLYPWQTLLSAGTSAVVTAANS
ncbi:hypothetical protein HDZ31DRAFT_8826, partial [Schizophyllum fasciatum]